MRKQSFRVSLKVRSYHGDLTFQILNGVHNIETTRDGFIISGVNDGKCYSFRYFVVDSIEKIEMLEDSGNEK